MSARHPKYDEILTLALAGNRPEEIGFMLNMSNRTVSEIMYRMRKTKKLPAYSERYSASESKGRRVTESRFRGLTRRLEALPSDIQGWLLEQTPEGATVADVVRAIVVDAYHESLENGRQTT